MMINLGEYYINTDKIVYAERHYSDEGRFSLHVCFQGSGIVVFITDVAMFLDAFLNGNCGLRIPAEGEQLL